MAEQQNEEQAVSPKVSVSETEDGILIEGDADAVKAGASQIANDDLEAGYRKARGEDIEDPDEEEELDVNSELEALRTFRDEANSKLEKATKKIQSLEGFKGSIKQQIEQGVRKALDEMGPRVSENNGAPSDEQIEAAMYDPEALKALTEEYPSFAPMAKSIEALNAKIDQLGSKGQSNQQQRSEPEAEVDLSDLDKAHPSWREDVATREFKEFALDGGPDISDYEQVAGSFSSKDQNAIAEAEAAVEDWRQFYPEWWDEHGSRLFGGIKGSLSLLDDYAKASKSEPEGDKDNRDEELSSEERRNLSRQKRIRRTVTPDTKGGAPATGMNDAEAFARGFQKARGH